MKKKGKIIDDIDDETEIKMQINAQKEKENE